MKNKEELEKKTGVKKWNYAIMNPPYDKSLHLKFLEKVIEVTDKVVTIQPVRWIEETVGPKKKTSAFNKYEDSIAKHIKELDIYSAEEAEKLFGAAFNFNIGIYVCDKEGGFDYSKLNTNKILDKVLEKMPDNIDNHIKFNEPNTAITVSLITGGNNGRNNVIDLYFQGSTYKSVIYDENSKRLDNRLTFYENRKKTAWGNVKVRGEQFNIKFKNIDECINFFNSTRTYLFRYIFNVVTSDIHVQAKFLPFMNDYSKPWTDERMYDYFNITKKEQKEIEERVDKIYNEIQQRIEEENRTKKRRKNKHFDICLMNPPYSNKEQFLDMKFVEEVNKTCDVVISVQPGQKFISGTSTINKIMSGNNFKEFEIFNANDAFNISTLWKYGGIYLYDNKNSYDTLKVTDINGETSNIEKTKEARTDFYNLTRFVGNIRKIINNKKELYNTLINDNKTMVNDLSNKLIYYDVELNRGKRFGVTRKNPNYNLQFVKDCLKDKKYKYCLYLCSFNSEEYVEPKEWNGENPDELFKKQVCWLTNSNTIKNNIKYWMASPLFDLWRRWFLNGRYRVNRIGCYYGFLPAIDFEMNENDFKEYVDSLNDFTEEEIKILKENNIHNAYKLKQKKCTKYL